MNLKEFYDNHIELLKVGDVNAMVDHDYHDGAVMILLAGDKPVYVKGKDELKRQMGYYLKNIYRGFLSTDVFAQTEDSLFFEATIDTVNGPSKVFDALYMKDGKIFRHYSGLK